MPRSKGGCQRPKASEGTAPASSRALRPRSTCSTPEGIRGNNTIDRNAAALVLAECSTPEGIIGTPSSE